MGAVRTVACAGGLCNAFSPFPLWGGMLTTVGLREE